MNKPSTSEKKDILKDGLHRLKLTKKDFAKEVGVTVQHVSQVIKGTSAVPQRMMDTLNRLLEEAGDIDALRSPDEAELLHLYRDLPSDGKTAIVRILQLIDNKKTLQTTFSNAKNAGTNN